MEALVKWYDEQLFSNIADTSNLNLRNHHFPSKRYSNQ